MKRKKFYYKLLIFSLVSISILSCIACSPQKKPMQKQAQTKEDDKKPPKELEDLKKALDNIEGGLEKLYEKEKQSKNQIISGEDIKKSTPKPKNNSSEGEKQLQIQIDADELSKYDQEQKKLEEENKKLKEEKEKIEETEKLKKDILNIHSLWNSFEPKAVADLASQDSIHNFENALNEFTTAMNENDVSIHLLSINELYKYLSDFFDLYETDEPSELYKLEYGIKRIKLVSEKGDFDSAKKSFDYIVEAWNKTKPKLKENSMSIMNKLNFSLNDLKTSIETENSSIIEAKTDVALKIIDELRQLHSD